MRRIWKDIRNLKGKFTQKKIAELFNMSTANVSKIMTKKLWAHI